MLDDSTEKPLEIPEEERMKRCEEFYNNRRSETPDLPKPTERFWISSNIDMLIISPIERLEKLFRIQSAIRKHRDISGRPRTLDDDRELYSVLADKTPADFRLPSRDEFLSREKLGAGCPNFWDSHSSCGKSCNLHKWGPCT
jgi:hypothetical protein